MVNLSWMANSIGDWYSQQLRAGRSWLGGVSGVSDFLNSEIDKSQLRGAEIEGVLSGLPIVDNFVRGINGIQQMEDLYNNTGKVVNYAGSNNLGTSGLGRGLETVANKIADGTHDLHQFYSGDSDDLWKQLSTKSNWNSKYHHNSVRMI